MNSSKITSRAVVYSDGKLLAVKLKAYGGKQARDFWCLPGGGIETGEDLRTSLIREMVEETGVKPVIGNLLYVQQFIYEGREQLEFFFHVSNADDYENPDTSKAAHYEEEIGEMMFIDPRSSNILPKFLAEENIEKQINGNSPTKIFNYL